ncbi:MAG: hypothetical protein AAGA54_35875 [Myxococcota bacterium]
MVPPSDDDKARTGPRVPPPPTMSFMKELSEDAAPAAAPAKPPPPPENEDDDASVDAPDADTPTDASETAAPTDLIDILHADLGRTPAAEAAPAPSASPRRGALPRPSQGAKRVSSRRDVSDTTRPRPPSATGLPTGLRPPGAPDEAEPEDTDVLILSAVEALTAGEPAPEAAPDDPDEPKTERAPVPIPASAPVQDAPASERRRPLWFWLVPAAALVGLGIWWAQSGTEDTEPTRTVAAASPIHEPSPETSAPVPDVGALTLDVGTPALDVVAPALDVGAPALEQALDVGDSTLNLDVGSPEPVAEPEPAPTKRRRTKTASKPSSARPAPPAPKPAAPSTAPDAGALLREAKAALSSGKHAEAYRLASKSRQAKRSSSALVVMATAACRMGSAPKAKSAFAQLKVSERRGIRAECRNKGIRLGL